MNYFRNIPTLEYDGQIIRDIFIRLNLMPTVKENAVYYEEYRVQEGETPEIVAHKYYGDVDYNWIVLHINNIIDPFYDWPLSQDELYDFMRAKYGEENVGGVHHYVTNSNSPYGAGIEIDSSHPTSQREAVSNLQYEDDLNDERRVIKLLRVEYLADVESEFRSLVG